MAYTGEVLRRARARLAEAKAQREAEIAQRLQQAYRQVPRLAEIDRALRLTMARAAQTVLEKGENPQEEFQRIRQENQGLQQERQALVARNFPPDYLDDTPICPDCGGTGYVGASMCHCLAELCRQEQQQALTQLTGTAQQNFGDFRLDYYADQFDPNLGASPRAVMAATLQTCRRYAQHFSRQSGNLLLNGNPGLGKTFLSVCIAQAVAAKGYSVVYVPAGHMFAQMEQAKFSGSEEARQAAEKYTACDLLVVDDLGAEMVTPFVQSALYGVLNDRLLDGIPTVVSSNLQAVDFSGRYGPAIASRLLGSYRLVAFVGEDVRLRRQREA